VREILSEDVGPETGVNDDLVGAEPLREIDRPVEPVETDRADFRIVGTKVEVEEGGMPDRLEFSRRDFALERVESLRSRRIDVLAGKI